jgi:hypothetical protein
MSTTHTVADGDKDTHDAPEYSGHLIWAAATPDERGHTLAHLKLDTHQAPSKPLHIYVAEHQRDMLARALHMRVLATGTLCDGDVVVDKIVVNCLANAIRRSGLLGHEIIQEFPAVRATDSRQAQPETIDAKVMTDGWPPHTPRTATHWLHETTAPSNGLSWPSVMVEHWESMREAHPVPCPDCDHGAVEVLHCCWPQRGPRERCCEQPDRELEHCPTCGGNGVKMTTAEMMVWASC